MPLPQGIGVLFGALFLLLATAVTIYILEIWV